MLPRIVLNMCDNTINNIQPPKKIAYIKQKYSASRKNPIRFLRIKLFADCFEDSAFDFPQGIFFSYKSE